MVFVCFVHSLCQNYANMKAKTQLIQDIRYTKQDDNTFPVRLRITYTVAGKTIQKYIPTGESLTKADWKKMISARPGDLKDKKLDLDEKEKKARAILDKMPIFSLDTFKANFEGNQVSLGTLDKAFELRINELNKAESIGTAIIYNNARVSLQKFRKHILLADITTDFLSQYEKWMRKAGATWTTIGMYLRCVRALINKAITNGEISAYPFGRGKYEIKSQEGEKKALTLAEIKKIYDYKPENSTTAMAKDFFMFSYLGNGMNVKDICQLKYKDIQGDILRFSRAKTSETRTKKKEIRVILREDLKAIIKRWGNKDRKPENYIFNILQPGLSAQDEKRLINQFTGLLNDHLKLIAEAKGIDKNLTTYVARHSFATILKRSGASTELISEALGHSDLKTTRHYLASFEDETLKMATSALVDFNSIKPTKKGKIINLKN